MICPLQDALLVGTSKGTIRIYNWPLIENSLALELSAGGKVRIKEPEYSEIIGHSHPITSLCASYD